MHYDQSYNLMKHLFTFCLVSIFFATILNSQCDYQLVWEDDFSGTSLNLNNWSYQTGAGGWGNNELQTYTNTNAQLQNGVLQIVAENPSNNNYTSSRIRSKEKIDFRYGKMEASIKLPQGQGIWPAFWMMPTCDLYGTWPSSGEIDIMEYLGHQTNTSYATCHFGNSPVDRGQLGDSYNLPSGDYTDGFHLFSIEWSENDIKWFVDDVLMHEVNEPDVAPYLWPFNEEFHFILNVAVGGNWPGSPDASTVFPQIMEVDYVRAYQLIEDFGIAGETNILPNSNNTSYTVPLFPNATYDWYLPSCATLVAGQGTNEVTLDWGTDSGELEVVIGLPCKTITKTLPINLTNNIWTNPGFETNTKGWNYVFNSGSYGSFTTNSNNPYAENFSACLNVQGLGNNFWDAQMRHDSHPVIAGQTYYLSFYAKADINTRQIRIDFRNTAGNISTDNVTFNLTDTWTLYQYQYTPATSIADLAVDFNHGFETGIFCYDQIQFEQTGPTIGTCPDQFCVNNLTIQNTLIEDNTYQVADWIDAKSLILNGQTVNFRAGQYIDLDAGFDVEMGSLFSAEIESCDEN